MINERVRSLEEFCNASRNEQRTYPEKKIRASVSTSYWKFQNTEELRKCKNNTECLQPLNLQNEDEEVENEEMEMANDDDI